MPELAERVQRVRLLLDSLNDPYPTPRGHLVSEPGPAASKRVPCETCKRRGHVRQRREIVLCLICDGRGWRRRQAGEAPWDEYVGLPVEEAIALPTMPTTRTLITEPEPERGFVWERARAAYDRHGSYKQLRAALDWLRDREPRRYTLVRAILIDHEPRVLAPWDQLALDLGVVSIALRMRTVRVPPWLMERERADDRRASIERMLSEGRTAGEIARRLGTTTKAIRRRLKGLQSGHAGVPARAT